MKYEVEQKYPLDDPTEVERQLATLGGEVEESQKQVDQYFNHPSRDFAQTDEALRIRSIGDKNFVTYKGPKIDKATKTRREIELPLTDGKEAAGEYAELLKALGFKPVAEVRKRRDKTTLKWEGKQVEAAVDRVEGLGSFLELEIVAAEDQVDQAKKQLESLAKHLKLGKNERRSYLELLLEKQ